MNLFQSVNFLYKALCLIIILPLLNSNTIAKTDSIITKDIAINATCYSFTFNNGNHNGSYAIGPSININTDGKISIQLGLLYDLKKYVFYEKHLSYTSGNFTYIAVNHYNIFLPLSLSYNYFRSERLTLFVTPGIMIGGINTLNEYNKAEALNPLNITLGAGISYKPTSRLKLQAQPLVRYNSSHYFPGIMMNIGILAGEKKQLPDFTTTQPFKQF